MKAIGTRIRKLEVGARIIETEESRREREFEETIRRRIVEGRARLGLLPGTFTDSEPREPAGMSVEEVLQRGRLRTRERAA